MKKRILALFLTCVILLSLCSCGNYSGVKVNGTKIRKGTYAYFLDRAKVNNSEASAEEQKQIAKDLVVDYVAINSEFVNRNLKLPTKKKALVSQNVDSNWNLFSSYYKEIGVSKQDLYEIEQNKAFREELLLNYYSEKGDKPVTEDQLRTYFYTNFAACRVITGYLTTVNENKETVPLADDKKQALITAFQNNTAQINEMMTSFDEVAAYAENVLVSSETELITRNTTRYPQGFIDYVATIENGKCGSFALDSYVYLVERTDITNPELDFYSSHRTEALKEMKGEEFNQVVDSWKQSYSVSK